MNKKAKITLIISGLTTIIISAFLALYYCVINKEHEGMMDWWAIVLLIIPLLMMIVSRIVLELNNEDIEESYKNKNFLEKIWITIKNLISLISGALILPFFFIYLIVELIGVSLYPTKKEFKKLLNKGFKYKKKDKVYILSKDKIVIEILYGLEDYFISFDNGQNFVRVEESELGFQHNRDELMWRLKEYKCAHPVDRQRGDAKPPLSYFIDFLDNFIE